MGPGSVLGGNYRVISLLGEGGMGAVWRAEQINLGSHVAVKVLRETEMARVGIRARFEAEAKIAASLRGPHVVQVFDYGIDEASKAPFIVMELLEGESLRDRLARTGPLRPGEVARIISHVAHALDRAHEREIIHRDLKPANIFLVRDADGEVSKVLDFGIAKRPAQFDLGGSTATGTLLGTPYYMSPEQIQSSRSVDFRSDLWSLAVIAVECMTGKVPFESDNLAGLVLQICGGHGTLPSQLGPVPAGLDGWFQRATRREPKERFESASGLAMALREVCRASTGAAASSEEASPTLTSTVPERARAPEPSANWLPYQSTSPLSRTAPSAVPPGRARRWRRMAFVATGAAALSLAAVVLWQRERAAPDAARQEPPSDVSRAALTPEPSGASPAAAPEKKPEPPESTTPVPSRPGPSIAPIPTPLDTREPAPAFVVEEESRAKPARKRSAPARATDSAARRNPAPPAKTPASRAKPKGEPAKKAETEFDAFNAAPDG